VLESGKNLNRLAEAHVIALEAPVHGSLVLVSQFGNKSPYTFEFEHLLNTSNLMFKVEEKDGEETDALSLVRLN
jgi:hypothetical protein